MRVSKPIRQKVKDWNDRAKAAQDRTGYSADRDRERIDHERPALQEEQKALDVERAKIGDGPQKAVDAFNEHAKALEQKSTDWNQRNAKFGDAGPGAERRQPEMDRRLRRPALPRG